MPSLDSYFRDLRARIARPDGLNPAHTNAFFYLCHDPSESFEVKAKLGGWKAQLESDGFTVVIESFATMLWKILEQTGELDEMVEMEIEEGGEPDLGNQSVSSLLESQNAFLQAFADIQSAAPEDAVILMTDAAALHPYYRVRSFENHPLSRAQRPTVIFYPGRRSGTYGLHFLGFYDNDPNYRSTIIGGHA